MANLEDRLTLAAFNSLASGQPGTCKLVWGTYTGTGEAGQAHPNTLTFDGTPLWVKIWDRANPSTTYIEIEYSCPTGPGRYSGGTTNATVNWDNCPVLSWYGGNDGWQLNAAGTAYCYIALVGVKS